MAVTTTAYDPSTLAGHPLAYPDANATPWPINHHGYVSAVAAAAACQKGVSVDRPELHIGTSGEPRTGTVLLYTGRRAMWSETCGWSWMGRALCRGQVLPAPADVAAALALVIAGAKGDQRKPRNVRDAHRDQDFERQLAAHRLNALTLTLTFALS